MKRSFLRFISLMVLVAVTVTVFAGCAKTLSGTYKTDSIMESYTSVTFSGNKITIKTFALGAELSSTEGTYEIADGTISITLGEGESSELSGDLAFSENEDGSIKIGLLTFKKQ